MVVKATGPTHEEVPIAHDERTQTLYAVAGVNPVNEAVVVEELLVGVAVPEGAVVVVLTKRW